MTAEPVGDLALKGFTRHVEAFNLLEVRAADDAALGVGAECKAYTMTR